MRSCSDAQDPGGQGDARLAAAYVGAGGVRGRAAPVRLS